MFLTDNWENVLNGSQLTREWADSQPEPEKERSFIAPKKKTCLSLGIFQGTQENHRP